MSFGGFTIDALMANKKQFSDKGWKGAFTPIDVGALNEYNALIQTLGNSDEALVKLKERYQDLSNATLTYIENAKGAPVQTDKLGKSFASLGLKAKAAQLGMMALNAALNVGISLAVSAAIQLATNVVTAQERAIEKAEELQSEWKNTSEALAETKNTVSEISGEYETLADGVDAFGRNISLTTDEYARYNEIANKIAEMFPEMVQGYTAEGNAIIKAKGSVEALTEAYEKMAEAQRGAVISGANDVIKGIQAKTTENTGFTQTIPSALGQLKALEDYFSASQNGDLENFFRKGNEDSSNYIKYNRNLEALNEALVAIGKPNAFYSLEEGASLTPTADLLEQNQKQLHAYARTLKAQINSAVSGYYPIIEVLLGEEEGYKRLEDETKALINSVVRGIDPEKILEYKDADSLGTYIIGEVLAPFENTNLSSSIAEALDLQYAFSESEIGLGKYKQSIEEVKNATKDMAPEVQDSILSMFDTSEADSYVNNLKEKILEEDWDKLLNLTLDDLKLAATLELETQISYGDLTKELEKARAESIKSASSITSSFQKTQESQKVLQDVRSELDALGSVSQESYDKLVESNEKFARALDDSTGYLSVNYDAIQDIIDAEYELQKSQAEQAKTQNLLNYRENAKELKSIEEELKTLNEEEEKYNELLTKQKSLLLQQEGILNEVRSLEILSSSLEYATSAYKKWLDAQDSPENSDIFDSLAGAIEDLKQGFETGKTGTQKFKSAAELIYGEDWVEMSREDMQNGLKELEKYFTEDSQGMALGVDKLTKAGILSKQGDQYFSVAGKSLEDYAEALGLSTEATRYFLAALKDYGWEIDIPGMGEQTELIQDYETALEAVEEQQDKVNKLLSKYDPQSATLEETKELVNEQSKLLDLQKQAAEAESKVSLEEPELTEIDLLKQELQEIQTAYDSLKDLAIKGNVDEGFLKELETVGDYIDKIYNVEELEKLKSSFSSQIANMESLMESGALPKETGEPLVENLKSTYHSLNEQIQELRRRPRDFVPTLVQEPVVVPVEVDTEPLEEAVEEVKTEAEKGVEIPVDYSKFGGGGGTFGEPSEEIQRQKEETLEEAQRLQEEIKQLTKAKEELAAAGEGDGFNAFTIDLLLEDAKGKLQELIENNKELDIQAYLDDSAAENAIDNLKQEAEEGATLPVKIETQGGGKNIFKSIFGFAKGTRNAPGGPALVGEGVKNGKFQPEIVVKKKTGEYFVTDHPQLVDLDRGDVVLNGEETKKVMKGSKAKSGFAYAAGVGNSAVKSLVEWASNIANRVDAATTKLKTTDTKNDVSASGKLSTKKSSGSSSKKIDPADLVDWIPQLLERLSKYTEKLVKQAEKAIGYMAQNMGLDKALANTKLELEKNEAAYARYMKQAEAVGLSKDLALKVQEGEIDIEAYDEATRELITNYQKWYDLANGCLDTVEELKEQQIELSEQKLENINTYYENRLDRLQAQVSAGEENLDLKAASGKEIVASDYNKIISATTQRIEQLTLQREALGTEFAKLVEDGIIQKDSDAWHEYTGQLEELDSSITQTEIDLIGFKEAISNLPLTNLEYALSALQKSQESIQSMMSLHEAQNADHEAGDYEKLIRNSMEQMNNLEKQNILLREQQMGLDVLSEKYQELQGEINSNEEEILQAKIAQEEWNDAILDLKIGQLEKEREELEKTNDAYQKQLDLQEALDELEKAKSQRTKLVYRENQGFVYEQDRDALKDAQERVNELRHQETLDKIDEAIEALENQKKDDNVYNYNGELIKPYANGGVDGRGGIAMLHGTPNHVETIFNAEDGKKLFDLIHGTNNLAHELMKGFDASALVRQIGSVNKSNPVSLSIGDIVIEKTDDANTLASDIVKYLPNAMLKEIYKN